MIDLVSIKALANVTMGQSPSGETYNEKKQGLPLLNGPTEFGPYHPMCTLYTTDSKRECKEGDLIFCVRGSTTGRMNLADKVYSLGRGVCAISSETPMLTRYIKYAFDYKLEGLLQLTGGGTFPNLSKPDIENFCIPFPKDYYKKIAHILSTYDDLLKNNLHRIQLLEEAARCHYKMLIGENEKYEKIALRSLISWTKGKKPKDISKDYLSDYLQYLVFDTLEETGIVYAQAEKVPVATTNDVLMCMDGARSGTVFRGQEGVIGSTFAYIRPKLPCLSEYLYQFLSEKHSYIVQGNVGSAIPHANREYINDLKIYLPEEITLNTYNNGMQVILSKIRNLKKQNFLLNKGRNVLLPQLMNGKIDVSSVTIRNSSLTESLKVV